MNVREIVSAALREAGDDGLRHPSLACSCAVADSDFMGCCICGECVPAAFSGLPAGFEAPERQQGA